MGQLDGVYAKLDRARQHAHDLHTSVSDWSTAPTYRFEREPGAKPGSYVWKVHGLAPLNPEWSVLFGDFLTNVRAALDHLAWQLAELDVAAGGQGPSEATNFPIKEQDVDRKGNPKPARIQGVVNPSVIAAVESVQPYETARRTGEPATHDVLYGLNKLVNIDKHRLLLVVVQALDIDRMWWPLPDGVPQPDLRLNPRPLSEGDTVAWFDFHGHQVPSDFDPHLALRIRLDDGPRVPTVRGLSLTNLVSTLYGSVEQVVGLKFASFFGLPPRHNVRLDF
jgi:hypothetical protein